MEHQSCHCGNPCGRHVDDGRVFLWDGRQSSDRSFEAEFVDDLEHR
jgi:hypothetical protein